MSVASSQSFMPGNHAELSKFQRMVALARAQCTLNSFEREERMRAYRLALQDADWHYAMASGAAYRDGRKQFDHLYEMQEEIDPMGEVWREIAPAGLAVPQPRVGGAS